MMSRTVRGIRSSYATKRRLDANIGKGKEPRDVDNVDNGWGNEWDEGEEDLGLAMGRMRRCHCTG